MRIRKLFHRATFYKPPRYLPILFGATRILKANKATYAYKPLSFSFTKETSPPNNLNLNEILLCARLHWVAHHAHHTHSLRLGVLLVVLCCENVLFTSPSIRHTQHNQLLAEVEIVFWIMRPASKQRERCWLVRGRF